MKRILFPYVILYLSLSAITIAQSKYTISGKIFDKKENTPLLYVSVLIEELKTGTYSDDNGNFKISNIPRGNYSIKFSLIGHKTFKLKITLPSAAAESLIIELEDGSVDIKEVVVTGNPFTSDPKDISQSILSITSLDLEIKKGTNLGETLNFQPGISVRSNGTAASRPIIRGFSNNRILILENGLRMGDLSNTSDDHSISSDGSSSEKIEVVRGPASLLYGSNAIGGVINVLTQSIPNIASQGLYGEFSAEGSTVNNQLLKTADFHYGAGQFAFHTNLYSRKAGDYSDPFNNKVSNSNLQSEGIQFGASYIPEDGVYGAGFSSYRNEYGLPYNNSSPGAEGPVMIKMKKDELRIIMEKSGINSFITSFSLKGGYQKYAHDEIAKNTGIKGTSFSMESYTGDLSVNHEPLFANSQGVLGIWLQSQKYNVNGDEAFTPNADYFNMAAYLLEQFKWDRINFQFGFRFESNRTKIPEAFISGKDFPASERSINSISASAGAVFNITDSVSIFSNIANAFRAPTIEEFSSYAVHEATGSFDIGDINLRKENNIGIDLGLRVRRVNHSVELSLYYNNISDYIYKKPTSLFYSQAIGGDGKPVGINSLAGFPVFSYTQSDALIYGFEAKAQYEFSRSMTTTVIFDFARGRLKGIDENLPFMPPLRFSVEQRYSTDTYWTGIILKLVNEQILTAPDETATKGYGLVDFYAGLRLFTGKIIHMFILKIDNALNQPYRDHLSAIKDFALLPGRNLRLNYKILF